SIDHPNGHAVKTLERESASELREIDPDFFGVVPKPSGLRLTGNAQFSLCCTSIECRTTTPHCCPAFSCTNHTAVPACNRPLRNPCNGGCLNHRAKYTGGWHNRLYNAVRS